MNGSNLRPVWRLWLVTTLAIALSWFALHAPDIRHMGNSIVLEMPPSREASRETVTPDFRQISALPQTAINFRADLLPHPVCLGLQLHPGSAPSGRLRITLTAGGTPLADAGIDAAAAAGGWTRICTDLPLGALQQPDVVVEVSSDPASPVHDLTVAHRRSPTGSTGPVGPALRLEARVPWSRRHMVGAVVISSLVLAALWLVISAQPAASRRVK